MDKKISIERKTENGFVSIEYTIEEAIPLLNNDIQNEMTIWIDSKPFQEEVITSDDLQKCRKEVSVTTKLVGG